MKSLQYVFLGLLVLLLSACSESDQPATTAQTPATQMAAATTYKVVESFNVGEGVYVRSLSTDQANNSIWVGTSVGVLQVDYNSRDVLQTLTRKDGLANEYVFAIFTDSKGYKWMGTDGGGMSRYKDGEWKTYFPMHGLADYWVYAFTEQKDGSLWVGTWAGLNVIDGETGVFTTYLEELLNEWVYGLDVDSKDRVWIGTEGGVNMFDGEKWYEWTHANGLGAANAQGLVPSTNTGLGTRSRHDLSVMAYGMQTYNPNYVFDIHVAPDDTVWAATWGGGVGHYDGEKWTNYSTSEGLAGNIVYSIDQSADGVLWFGTSNGLTSFDGQQWRRYTMDDGLLDNNVYDIAITPNGDVWVGTRNGVARLSR